MSAKTNIMYEYGAQKFWKWFKENEEWINNCTAKVKTAVVRAVDKKLKEAFPYIKGGFDFLLGYNQENGEFYFHHWGRKELICAGKALKKLIPPEVAKRWKVDVKKYPPFMR